MTLMDFQIFIWRDGQISGCQKGFYQNCICLQNNQNMKQSVFCVISCLTVVLLLYLRETINVENYASVVMQKIGGAHPSECPSMVYEPYCAAYLCFKKRYKNDVKSDVKRGDQRQNLVTFAPVILKFVFGEVLPSSIMKLSTASFEKLTFRILRGRLPSNLHSVQNKEMNQVRVGNMFGGQIPVHQVKSA